MSTPRRKLVLAIVSLSLLAFCGLSNAEKAEKQEVKSKEYKVEVYIGQEHLPDFQGCKTWVSIGVDPSCPYFSGFEIVGSNPNAEVMHSLSDGSVSIYFNEPLTNAKVSVRYEANSSNGIKVVVKDDNNLEVLVSSKDLSYRVWSHIINPPPKEEKK